MARFLVSGGCGFIGSHLVEQLVTKGDKVLVLDNLSSGKLTNLCEGAEFVEGDVLDRQTVHDCISGIDGIFHLAAISSVARTTENWPECHSINQTGTINLFDSVANLKQKTVPVVYASSAAVYGDKSGSSSRSETECPAPISAYGADKLGCELHARVAKLVHNVPTVGLRFFNVYGPRQDPSSPYSGVISIFADRVRRNLPLTIFGDGSQVRDFVFVLDAVKFLIRAMEECNGNDIYNVCTGQGTNIAELAKMIAEIQGVSSEIEFRPSRKGDIKHSVGSPEAAYASLHCRADTDVRRGLRLTISHKP